MLNEKLNIKENNINSYFYIDTKIQNKRYQTKSRFKSDENKKAALDKIETKKQEIIKQLSNPFQLIE